MRFSVHNSGFRVSLRRMVAAATLLAPPLGPMALPGAPVDENTLPPPATARVEFARDIKPIFVNTCHRCHGPEKPKSKFRLDSRAAALAGGANGIAILPGQSGRSPLIHYVARLVADKEMPPPGKGEPLTREQIGLLRAWVDQGVDWPASEASAESKIQFSVSPTIRWIRVQGDPRKFREDWGLKEGASGGFESFKLGERLGDDTTISVEGRALSGQEDYKFALTLEKNEFGFARAGFEQYRKYYDASGGYYPPFGTPALNLDRDLHLDIGQAWAEFGLTLPDWPRLVFGYEYHFRDGVKSTLQWGGSTSGAETRLIFPSYQDIDEKRHVIRFDLDHEWRGLRVENNFRAEFYDLATERKNVSAIPPPTLTPDSFALVKERHRQFQGVNAFRLERQFTDWLFVSGGHFYSRLDADAAFRLNTVNGAGAPLAGDFWTSQQILLGQETHVLNANTLLGPWAGLTFSAGLQSEWSQQEGLGHLNLDFGDAVAPPLFVQPVMVSANLDKNSVAEHFGLRYTRIPHTVLFAETRFQQERIGQFEHEAGTPADYRDFLRHTDATSDLRDYRAGVTVSPWPRVSFNTQVRHRDKQSDYRHDLDQSPAPFSGGGYSAFIRSRELTTDEVEARLSWRTAAWLKTSFTYKLAAVDYTTVTDSYTDPFLLTLISPGGAILAGNYDAHVYSVNTVVTPRRGLYLSTTLSYSASSTRTAQNGNPSIVPYRGDTYSVLTSGTLALNSTTDLSASYSFSRADYGQNNVADGLPLGLEYQRHAVLVGVAKRWKRELTTNLQYGFFQYAEPSGGGFNNYTAHGIFATLTKKWP